MLAACQEHAEPTLTPGQKKKVQANLLTEAPKPQHAVGAVIENQVKLLGYDIDKTEVDPGGQFTVTYYIEALAPKPDDNMLFVHFHGKSKSDRRSYQNQDHHPIEGLLPLRKLKKGQIVRDVQTIKVRADFPPGDAFVYWGLFRGNYRLKITNPKDVQHDNDNRVRLAKVRVKGEVKKAKKKPLPLATAIRTGDGESITIDGKLDEPVWDRAPWTAWWTAPNGKGGAAPRTRARFAWDGDALYVGVFSHDADVWSTFTDRDSNTWEQEVIELFIDADGDRKDYVELQVTPANVVFDARFEKHRSDLAKARAWNMAGFQTAVTVDGTLNKREDTDRSFTVEMKIPAAQVPGAKALAHGQQWRVNLFRWDAPKAGRQKAAAFSPPIVPDFHALQKFGRLRFVDPTKAKAIAPVTPALSKKPLRLDPRKIQKLGLKPPKSKK